MVDVTLKYISYINYEDVLPKVRDQTFRKNQNQV